MAYTENKSIDWLTATTPTTDDLVVTMDQAEVWVAKSSTLLSIYNLFKTTYDTVYAKYLGDADFYKYSIVTSVASWNLTVALKNYEGNDPTPSKPVKIQIGGVIRTITADLSLSPWYWTTWTNWYNAGSTELATKEIDFFAYLRVSSDNSIRLFHARIPYANTMADFSASGTYTNEKYWMDSGGIPATTDSVVNIGRFNAILSGGAWYTWSIPATSVIINSPCYETREFDMNIIPNWSWTITSIDGISWMKYKISGNVVKYNAFIRFNKWTLSGDVWFKLPFTNNKETQASWYVCSVIATTPYTSLWVRFVSWTIKALKQSYTSELQYSDIWTDVVFSISWSYNI